MHKIGRSSTHGVAFSQNAPNAHEKKIRPIFLFLSEFYLELHPIFSQKYFEMNVRKSTYSLKIEGFLWIKKVEIRKRSR